MTADKMSLDKMTVGEMSDMLALGLLMRHKTQFKMDFFVDLQRILFHNVLF
jgi:hypothetical protein